MPDHHANKNRQKDGVALLQEHMQGFYVPSAAEKKQILDLLGISSDFKQTFDAIRLHVPAFDKIRTAKDFDLLEMKATAARLPNLPRGFFFGMTENEEMLLKVFAGKYFLCLVCLHPDTPGYKLISWRELKAMIQNRRVQYQINLHRRD